VLTIFNNSRTRPIFLTEEYREQLGALGELEICDSVPASQDEFVERIKDAEVVIVVMLTLCVLHLRNDETIISSISVTDIFFDVYLGKWNYRAIPKVKTWSYFLTIPKLKMISLWQTGFNNVDLKAATESKA